MLINYFDEDYQSLMKYLEEKGEVLSMGSYDCDYTTFYFRGKESDNKDYYPHIKILSTDYLGLMMNQLDILRQKMTQLLSPNSMRVQELNNGIFLLNIFHIKRVNSETSLLRLKLPYNDKEDDGHICNMLQQEIEQYSQLYNVEPNNIKLSLIRLFGFERLKFNSDDLEKYIQLKNKELSRCTEEELNKQVEKFFDPYNYPHYFKTEVCAYLGTEIAKQVEKGIHSGVADSALDSLNPDNSLQTLKVLALAAIGKFAIQ
ncbi:MAG: hypothetical protein U0X86_000908 [Wolbachia endosymbiont of Xenopsylla cheopis]